jgi:protein phosphatase
MNCPNCGKENSEEEKYCEDCGAQLNQNPPEQGAEVVTESLLMVEHELLGRYRITKAESYGKINRYSAQDKLHDNKEVFVYERPVPPEGAEVQDPLKLQWDMLRELNDPRFPVLSDFFQEGSRNYMVMEACGGESFEERMKKEKVEPEKVFKWGAALCEIVGLIHKKNALHRNIQPSSVILKSDGSLMLTGFDRLCPADRIPEEWGGIPGFSAPEAYGIGEAKLDARSDIYSIGATLYCLLAGKIPQIDQRESFFSFPPLSENGVKIRPEMEKVIMTAVSKKAESRYGSVDEFKLALDNALLQKAEVPVVPQVQAAANSALSMNIGMCSNIGMVREINQDSCLFMNFAFYEKSDLKEGALFIVADGMGGEAEGEKASSLAIRAISRYVLDSYVPIETGAKTRKLDPLDISRRTAPMLAEALKEANRIVFEYSQQDISRKGMGSTISAALIDGNNLVIAHAGDTRLYVINEVVEQVTEDHSLVGRLVKMGQLKKEEALRSPQRSLVYRALGTNPELEVDSTEKKLNAGDWIFICSDGCWEYFLDDELLQVFHEYKEPQDICDRLIALCLERGADDNCTAIVVKMSNGES